MKYVFIFLIAIVISNKGYGRQVGNVKLQYKDSVELSKTWIKFKAALLIKDVYTLKKLSRKDVVGEYLFEPISLNHNYKPYVSIDTLLAHLFQQKMLNQINIKDKYKITVDSALKDKNERIKYLTEYQIWYTNRSEPGFQLAFIFVKVKGKFKFDGLTSIP